MRVGEKEVSEQAAIVARYADLFTRPQLDGSEGRREGGRRGGPRADLPAALDLRGRHRGGRAGRALRRARERDPRRAGLLAAETSCRCERRRRGSRPSRPTWTATRSARRSSSSPRASTTSGAILLADGEALAGRSVRRARPGAPQRGGKADRAPSAARRARHRARWRRLRVRRAARALARATARAGARADADVAPRAVDQATLAARGDVHEGAGRAGRACRRSPRSASSSGRSPGSDSTSTTVRRSRRARA